MRRALAVLMASLAIAVVAFVFAAIPGTPEQIVAKMQPQEQIIGAQTASTDLLGIELPEHVALAAPMAPTMTETAFACDTGPTMETLLSQTVLTPASAETILATIIDDVGGSQMPTMETSQAEFDTGPAIIAYGAGFAVMPTTTETPLALSA